MAYKRVLGKFLLVLGALLSGVAKLAEPVEMEKTLISSYSKFFSKSKEFGLTLPLAPVMVANYSNQLITLTGILLIVGSLLVLFNSKLGAYILTLLYLSFCIIIHSPILYSNPVESTLHTHQLLLNLVVVAGFWMTCTKVDAPTKEESPTHEPYKGKSAWQRKKKE